jgi:hypothetical protein
MDATMLSPDLFLSGNKWTAKLCNLGKRYLFECRPHAQVYNKYVIGNCIPKLDELSQIFLLSDIVQFSKAPLPYAYENKLFSILPPKESGFT